MEYPQHHTQFLAKVEEAIDGSLSLDYSPRLGDAAVLTDAARHLCLAEGAKRMRPLLVRLLGEAVDVREDDLIPIAVASEFIHAASLLHDDIVDSSTTRRGLATVNAKWNNITAVLTGDFVLTIGFTKLEPFPHEVMVTAVHLVNRMVQAVMKEVLARNNVNVTVDDWMDIAHGKTGDLFAWCGRTVGTVAGDRDAAYRFEACASHLGIAFQIADDIKDLNGGDPGKPRFTDIREKNTNFVVLQAFEEHPDLRSDFATVWNHEKIAEDDIRALGFSVLETSAMEYALHSLHEEIDAALDALGPWAHEPGGRDIATWTQAMRLNTTKGVAL